MVAHRIEMPHRSTDSYTIDVIRRCYAQTARVQAVLVVGGAEPGLLTGRMERLLDGRRQSCLATPDGNWSVRTVTIIILNVEIALRFTKVRHDLFVRPLFVAESRPRVKILREPALHRLAVDR